jgi:anti-sigma factor (TIGR02949 family)
MARATSRSPRQPRPSKRGPRGNALKAPPPRAGRQKSPVPVNRKQVSPGNDRGRCTRVLTRLQKFIENEFSPAQRREIDRHLAGCPDCRREYEAMRSLIDTLDQSRIVQVPDSFRSALMAKIRNR